MVLGFKIKLLGLTEIAQRLVVLLAARKKVLVGKVGKPEHNGRKLRLDLLESLVNCLGLCGKLLHLNENSGNVLSLLLVLRDKLVHLVLLCLYCLGLGDKRSSFSVKSQYLLYLCLCVLSLFSESRKYLIGFFLNISDV